LFLGNQEHQNDQRTLSPATVGIAHGTVFLIFDLVFKKIRLGRIFNYDFSRFIFLMTIFIFFRFDIFSIGVKFALETYFKFSLTKESQVLKIDWLLLRKLVPDMQNLG